MQLKLSEIVVDERIQIRHGLDPETLDRYVEGRVWEAAPVTVFDGNLLGDGFHRYRAAEIAGVEELPVERRQGGRREAEDWAVTANAKHPQALTAVEREDGVLRLLDHGWSHSQIGEALGIHQSRVGQLRRARDVRQETVSAGVEGGERLAPSTLTEIGRAPREEWVPLARQAVEQEWTRDETREQAQRVKLGLRAAQDADAYLALLRLMEVFERADSFGPKGLAASVPSDDVETVQAAMRRIGELSRRLVEELEEGRKLKAVT